MSKNDSTTLPRRAAELVRRLALTPHPEGGFFREVFRSTERVRPSDGRASRSALTTIFFLLVEGHVSRWHAVASDEVWHLYEGGPLELFVAPPDVSRIERALLGPVAWRAAHAHCPGPPLAGCATALRLRARGVQRRAGLRIRRLPNALRPSTSSVSAASPVPRAGSLVVTVFSRMPRPRFPERAASLSYTAMSDDGARFSTARDRCAPTTGPRRRRRDEQHAELGS